MTRKLFYLSILSAVMFGCGAASDIADLTNIAANPPQPQEIDRSKVGVQNFFTDQGSFGSVDSQYQDIAANLHIHFVRILVPWLESLQPGPNSRYDFSEADSILKSIPPGVDVLVTLAHTPSWFPDPSNWVNGNPRQTWVEHFVRPVVQHFANTPGIIGWEVFNEPDHILVPSDGALGITDATKYVEMLQFAHDAIQAEDPGKLVVMAASQSIQQNWPTNFDYNHALRDAGAANFTDVWNIHYYGEEFDKVVVSGGVADFLNSIGKTVWVTESGQQGPTQQLTYVQTVWPFLSDQVSGIDRFYYFEYSSTAPAATSFGLRNSDPAFPLSDLYVNLHNGPPPS